MGFRSLGDVGMTPKSILISPPDSRTVRPVVPHFQSAIDTEAVRVARIAHIYVVLRREYPPHPLSNSA